MREELSEIIDVESLPDYVIEWLDDETKERNISLENLVSEILTNYVSQIYEHNI